MIPHVPDKRVLSGYFSIKSLTENIMSKDKGSKNVKKALATEGRKAASDYQAGKKSVSKDESFINKKK